MKKIALLIIILFQLCSFYSQKLYYGFGYHIGLLSRVNIGFNYLSESPYFMEPVKIEQHKQLNLTASNTLNTSLGLQFKNNFIEFNCIPYNVKNIKFKGLKINELSNGSSLTKFQYGISNIEFNLQLKKILTGRRPFRIASMIGLGTYRNFGYITEINEIQQDLDLIFLYERKMYHLLQLGVGFLNYNGKDNFSIFVNYSHQLTNYTDKLKVGFVNLVFSYIIYHNKPKRKIYVSE